MISLGEYHNLLVLKSVSIGFYLDAGELGEVLLPAKYAPRGLNPDDHLKVFLYLDSEDRPVATTLKAKACVGQFAYLEVVAVSKVGAFLDWGLAKDVLLPFSEQHRPLQEGQFCLVYLFLSKVDGRITASSKLDKFLKDEAPGHYKPRQEVELIIANSTELGFKAIINHSHWGLIHKSEVFQRLSFGQSMTGYIKTARADGKIDLSLQGGKDIHSQYCEKIEAYLKNNNGFSPLHDKSKPEEISKVFGMSKAAFKNAIGRLYKQKTLKIEKNGIRLLVSANKEIDSEETAVKSENNSTRTRAKVDTPKKPVQTNVWLKARDVEIFIEPVELYKILKFEGLVNSGADAKNVIAAGEVLLNGEIETQKRKKIRSGDVIELGQEKIRIQLKAQ